MNASHEQPKIERLLMITYPLYRQTPSARKASSVLKYVTQRSLAVVLFLALAVVASIANKPSERTPSPSLNQGQFFDNVVRSIKDAFNDPALVQYANDQAIPDSPEITTPSNLGKMSAEDFGNKCVPSR